VSGWLQNPDLEYGLIITGLFTVPLAALGLVHLARQALRRRRVRQ
jgi:hypothetical protein